MSKIVSVVFSTKYKDVKKKVENNLLWYDGILKKMKTFQGGRLDFKYGLDEELVEAGYHNPYRMIPKAAALYERSTEPTSNREDVLKWFDDFQNYDNSDAVIVSEGDNSIDFEVPDNEFDDFTHGCDSNSFIYSV